MKKTSNHIIRRFGTFYKVNRFSVWFFVILWLSLSLITSNKDILYLLNHAEYPLSMPMLYLRGFLIWTLAACFVPFIVMIARRFPVDQKKYRLRNLLFHVVCSICFLVVITLLFNIIFQIAIWHDLPFMETWFWVMRWFNLGAPVGYWFIIGGLFLHRNAKLYNTRHQRAIALQSELKEIQLKLLQMQLRPHFLFNALNTVSALLFEDRKAAAETLKKIRIYLELTMKETDKTEITLTEELHYTTLYLEIEKERYSDRLHVEMHTDPDIKNAMVPNMLLQPLVENAVRHGIARENKPGMIIITTRRTGQTILFEIENSGKGEKNKEIIEINNVGFGIKNTIERLEKLYKKNYRFGINRSELGGYKISIQIPLKHRFKPMETMK